jgi:Protein of unknown function (DUF3593)/Protein of unknown function (DUF2499)
MKSTLASDDGHHRPPTTNRRLIGTTCRRRMSRLSVSIMLFLLAAAITIMDRSSRGANHQVQQHPQHCAVSAFVSPQSRRSSASHNGPWTRTERHQNIDFLQERRPVYHKITTTTSTAAAAATAVSTIQLANLPPPSTLLAAANDFVTSNMMIADIPSLSTMTSWLYISRDQAEQLAGPFFGASLFPYLAFLWLLARPENNTPKGVTVGFATCLLFVFLTIPAAIAAQVLYGISLADSDWLHGSAESLLTITNLVTVVAFRQALSVQEQNFVLAQTAATKEGGENISIRKPSIIAMPRTATMWSPMIWLVTMLTVVAIATAVVPAISDPTVHTPYLGGFLDLPTADVLSPPHPEPDNALTVATWIIHISSLVEFLVAMGFCWRWADVTQNPTWKGLTWGLLPLHSSGITACTYHVFYNQIPILVPIQALLTCVGNTTAAWATYRIARSNGWTPSYPRQDGNGDNTQEPQWVAWLDQITNSKTTKTIGTPLQSSPPPHMDDDDKQSQSVMPPILARTTSPPLLGFEDLGPALAGDNDYSFLLKLFVGCAVASYVIKYGEIFFDFPFEADVFVGFGFILIPSSLNAYKWYRRSQDPTFDGWF